MQLSYVCSVQVKHRLGRKRDYLVSAMFYWTVLAQGGRVAALPCVI